MSNVNKSLENNRVVPKAETFNQSKHYPCLCEVTKNVLFWTRIFGILPIKSTTNVKEDVRTCYFEVSKFWVTYSAIFQLLYFVHFCVVYGIQLSSSQDANYEDIDWYLMTAGYIVSDVDAIVTMFVGSFESKRICKILENLSKMDSSIVGMRTLRQHLNTIVRCVLIYFIIIFASFLFIAIFQPKPTHSQNMFPCGVLEKPFAVTMRGFGIIFPTMQVAIVCMFTLLLEKKFEYLADSVAITMENMSLLQQQNSYVVSDMTATHSHHLHSKQENNFQKLDQLAETHQQIFDVLSEVNFCTGLQFLIGCCSSLYTIIYYLFRCVTASTYGHRSNNPKIHYILSLIFRFFKILTMMFLGHRLGAKSLLPLQAVQRARFTNFSLHEQQQVQTLMLRWFGKRAYLSACGIVNLGPWLLAPIAGNVITYLLVALQFDNSDNSMLNGANFTTTV